MRLKRISGQASTQLQEFYDPSRWPAFWHQRLRLMSTFLDYLESVDFPDQWVCTSHEALVFLADDHSHQSIIRVTPREAGEPTDSKTFLGIGYGLFDTAYQADSPEEAWAFIRERVAATNINTLVVPDTTVRAEDSLPPTG